MASALGLTAQATISSGQGLATSANLLSQISTFQNHGPIKTLANVFATVTGANANVISNVASIVANVGTGVTKANWLIDLYPSNVTPVCSGSIYYYGQTVTASFSGVGPSETITWTYSPIPSTASFSHTLTNQAQLPFTNGLTEFANVYSMVSGYASSVFDTVSSVYLLRGKTFAQHGITYSGVADLVSSGVGHNGDLLSQVVQNWGTMYDVANINKLSNPYVFGQNLLNQGLGSYGSLADKLTEAGLNIANLLQVPASRQLVTQVASSVTASTPIGEIELPTLANVVTTISVTGNSPSVVLNIYKSITGSDLAAIVAATGAPTNTSLVTLADYLDLSKVVDAGTLLQLHALNITDFASLSTYMQARLGQGYYKSWSEMAGFLGKLDVPAFSHTSLTTGSSVVLPETVATTLLAQCGTGTGPFNNPVISDYLGACAGIPYTDLLFNMNQYYDAINTTNLQSKLNDLDSAVTNYVSTATSNLFANLEAPDTSSITSAVAGVNSALNSISDSPALTSGTSNYYTALRLLSTEVSNLQKTGAVFNAGSTGALTGFASNFTTAASDKIQLKAYDFFGNLITADSSGDVLRAALAETVNTKVLGGVGIDVKNDPQPATVLYISSAQNIPLSTYLSRNK